MDCAQASVTLSARKRGCHLVTDEIVRQIESNLSTFEIGMANFFMQHTSASLCLNENWDSDVRKDMEDALNDLAPENRSYRHSAEGPDDMPAHIKSALLGATISVPITKGRLNMGTWQGIWMCEHRNHASGRHLVVTMFGKKKGSK